MAIVSVSYRSKCQKSEVSTMPCSYSHYNQSINNTMKDNPVLWIVPIFIVDRKKGHSVYTIWRQDQFRDFRLRVICAYKFGLEKSKSRNDPLCPILVAEHCRIATALIETTEATESNFIPHFSRKSILKISRNSAVCKQNNLNEFPSRLSGKSGIPNFPLAFRDSRYPESTINT